MEPPSVIWAEFIKWGAKPVGCAQTFYLLHFKSLGEIVEVFHSCAPGAREGERSCKSSGLTAVGEVSHPGSFLVPACPFAKEQAPEPRHSTAGWRQQSFRDN